MTTSFAQVLEHPQYLKFSRYLPRLVALLFLILIGIALARLVLMLITPAPQIIPTQTSSAAPVKRGPVTNYASITAARHIFGKTEAKVVEVEKEPEKEVETKLNLKLRGVFAIDDKELGLALISNGNGPEEVYAVDDKISGNTKLAAVYPDRVMLNVRGKYETLRLPDTKDTGVFVPTAAALPSRSTNIPQKAGMANAVAEKSLGDYRKEFLRNPTTIARLVNVTQANDESGNPIGYKVSANGQHPAFDQLGVEDGDVITSINGIELDSTAKGMSAFQALRQSQQVTVQLLRNGQPTTLNLTF